MVVGPLARTVHPNPVAKALPLPAARSASAVGHTRCPMAFRARGAGDKRVLCSAATAVGTAAMGTHARTQRSHTCAHAVLARAQAPAFPAAAACASGPMGIDPPDLPRRWLPSPPFPSPLCAGCGGFARADTTPAAAKAIAVRSGTEWIVLEAARTLGVDCATVDLLVEEGTCWGGGGKPPPPRTGGNQWGCPVARSSARTCARAPGKGGQVPPRLRWDGMGRGEERKLVGDAQCALPP